MGRQRNTATASLPCWPYSEERTMSDLTTPTKMPTDVPAQPTPHMEDIDAFRQRARAWLSANMKKLEPNQWEIPDRDSEAGVQYGRELMSRLYEGGFSGICFPKEDGGPGL